MFKSLVASRGRLAGHRGLVLSGWLLLSCARPVGPTTEQTLAELRDDLNTARNELADLKTAVENDRRQRFSDKYCKDNTVARFMEALRTSPMNACAEVELDNALNFMHTQRWVFAWMRPHEGIAGLHPTRAGGILRNLRPEMVHASTRVLVMVQPHEESLEAMERARRLGDAVRDKVKELLPEALRQTQVMPTYFLPCTLVRSRGKLKRYKDADGTPYNESLPGEPGKKEPRVAVWIFFTDC